MKRAIKLDGTDIELVISRATQVNIPKPFFYLWELNDGTWRVEYSPAFIPSLALLDKLQFNRVGSTPNQKTKNTYPNSINMFTRKEIEADKEVIIPLLMINKVTAISGDRGDRFIQLEPRDGLWRFSYWKSLVPDFHKVTGLSMVRED